MALSITKTLGPGVVSPPLYAMVNKPTVNKIDGTISGELWFYGSREIRLQQAEITVVVAEKQAAFIVARDALEALKPAPGDTAEQIHEKEVQSASARMALDLAAIALKVEGARLNGIGAWQIGAFTIPATEAAAIIESGVISLAAVYAWLKQQPDMAGAVDC